MSEIKGQILGVVLVLIVFGAVAAALVPAFTNASDTIADRIEGAASGEEGDFVKGEEETQNYSFSNNELLTF